MVHCSISYHFLMRCGFLTADPVVSIPMLLTENECFRVLRDATQPWYTIHNSHSVILVAFSSPGCSSTLVMWKQTLVSSLTTRFAFIELTLGRMPKFTRRSCTGTFQILSVCLSKKGSVVTFSSDTSFPRRTSTTWHWWLRRCGGSVTWSLGTIVALESYLPTYEWRSKELVKLQFRHLLSLLSGHVVLRQSHPYCRTRTQRFRRKCRHWNCASTLLFISCEQSPCPCCLRSWSLFS